MSVLHYMGHLEQIWPQIRDGMSFIHWTAATPTSLYLVSRNQLSMQDMWLVGCLCLLCLKSAHCNIPRWEVTKNKIFCYCTYNFQEAVLHLSIFFSDSFLLLTFLNKFLFFHFLHVHNRLITFGLMHLREIVSHSTYSYSYSNSRHQINLNLNGRKNNT